jgi:plastocyanin
MRRPLFPVLLVLVTGLALASVAGGAGGASLQGSDSTPPASPGASPAASPMASPGVGNTVAVAIVDYGFDAAEMEVPVGTTVIWTNTGGVIHTTTAQDSLWDSGILNTGEAFSYTFTEPGTYAYGCALHPKMLATIVVTGP